MSFKYRKKPVVIEAFQLKEDTDETTVMPLWFVQEITDGRMLPCTDGSVDVFTLEGKMTANIGDYIIRGVKGEIYPCKPDIFELTYDKVE
jgi:hypothetical protein